MANMDYNLLPERNRNPLLWLAVPILLIAGLTPFLTGGRELRPAANFAAAGVTAVQEQILASTLQLELQANRPGALPTDVPKVARALGTLVESEGQRFILTHNHWPMSVVEVQCLLLRDAEGELILTLDRATFLSLVRYQDEGTLLLAAPPALSGAAAAPLGDSSHVQTSDSLWFAAHSSEQDRELVVTAAQAVRSGRVDMPGTLRLKGPETAVDHGDSGGGVWHDGYVVGNIWAFITTPQLTPEVQQALVGEPRKMRPSGNYLAAKLPRYYPPNTPLPGQSRLTAKGRPYESGLLP